MHDSWRYILEKFRIEAPSEQALYYYFIFGIAAIILLVLWEVLQTLRRRRKLLALEWNWFYKLAEAKDLSEEEAESLAILTRNFFPRAPQRLLQSVRIFDDTVKQFLNSQHTLEFSESRSETEELFDSVREKLFMKEFHSQDNLHTTRQIPPYQAIRITIATAKGSRFLHAVVSENTMEHITLHCERFKEYKNLFLPDARFTGYYWRERDAGYQFPMVVTECVDDTHVRFDHSEEFSRKQRRHFFRVRINIIGRFVKLTEDEIDIFWQTQKLPEYVLVDSFLGKIISLSGGGISFFAEEELEKEDVFQITLFLSKGQSFTGIIGRVIRADPLNGKFKVFVEFISVAGKTREAIIHYVSLHQQAKKPTGHLSGGR